MCDGGTEGDGRAERSLSVGGAVEFAHGKSTCNSSHITHHTRSIRSVRTTYVPSEQHATPPTLTRRTRTMCSTKSIGKPVFTTSPSRHQHSTSEEHVIHPAVSASSSFLANRAESLSGPPAELLGENNKKINQPINSYYRNKICSVFSSLCSLCFESDCFFNNSLRALTGGKQAAITSFHPVTSHLLTPL